MSEHVEQDLGLEPVRMAEKVVEKAQKRRTQSDKVGINKYNQHLLKRALTGIEDIKCELRWVRHRFERMGEAVYSSGDVEHFAVEDEVDREIVQRVREAGSPGVLPKFVAADVNKRLSLTLRYYEVSRRILRMNKKLHFETGKYLFEKRGHRWALTSFGFEAYGSSTEDLEGDRAGFSLTAEVEDEETSTDARSNVSESSEKELVK